MKVALYARVSTYDKQQNPEMQLESMRKYCGAMGWEIYQEFVDKAKSSDYKGRKAWAQLLKEASLHTFDILLIWKLDRAFRSMVNASNTLQDFNRYKVGFRSLMDPSMDTSTANGMLVFNILASVAQFEKDLIVMRVMEGMTYAKEHGTKSGKPIGRRAYGIALANLSKALIAAKGNQSAAARELSIEVGHKVSAGFISSRIKRAGLTKEDITGALQTLPDKKGEKHDGKLPANKGFVKEVVSKELNPVKVAKGAKENEDN